MYVMGREMVGGVSASEQPVHGLQLGLIELARQREQAQAVLQHVNARLQQGQVGAAGIVFGIQQVQRGAVAHLSTQPRGVKPGLAVSSRRKASSRRALR